jgi:hypothetical protein
MKPELEVIQRVVASARLRLRWQRGLNLLGRVLFYGTLAWACLLIAYKLLPVPPEIVAWSGLAVLVTAATGGLAGFLGALPDAVVARQVDAAAKLKDRVSTAVEIRDTSTEWARLQLADAAAKVKDLQGARLFPVRLHRTFSRSLPALLVAAILTFVPEYRTAAHQQAQTDKAVLKDVGANLAQVLKRETEKPVEKMPDTVNGIEGAIDLAKEIEKAKLTRTDALRELSNVQKKLEDQARELGKIPGLKPLQQAAKQSQGKSPAGDSEMQKKLAEARKAMDKQGQSMEDALDQMKKEMEKAKEAGTGMAGNDSGMTPEAKQQMAQQLAEMAKQAQAMGASLPDLEAAIQALQNSQPDAFLRDMNSALNDLEKLQEMAKAIAEAEKMSTQEQAKTLAEQLQKGQFQAARETLDKMSEQLKKGQIGQDEMEKMLAEVAKAAKPGDKFGKVGEMLKKAASEMKAGNKSEGGKQLAAASEELKRLLDQMGDMDALEASLDALNRAQLALSQCKSWGQCNNPGKGRPKMGKGGKAGPGVGTWEPEGGYLYYPEMSELYDYSDMQRPDMDGKGLTDRGDGELAAGLNPTKLNGQMSPGGPMPSITLKGVSIKGTSKVKVQEAVTAAQSEARAAISDEKVPRAYRGAVRDYFDDLKE